MATTFGTVLAPSLLTIESALGRLSQRADFAPPPLVPRVDTCVGLFQLKPRATRIASVAYDELRTDELSAVINVPLATRMRVEISASTVLSRCETIATP